MIGFPNYFLEGEFRHVRTQQSAKTSNWSTELFNSSQKKTRKHVQKVQRKMTGCGYYTNNFEQNLDIGRGLSDKFGCIGRFRTKIAKFTPLAVQLSSISV